MHNGLPEVYYYDISSDDIYLCQARDAAGSDWDPPYELVANLGNSGGNLGAALVDNLPVLAYKWFDFGNDVNEIRSASYY